MQPHTIIKHLPRPPPYRGGSGVPRPRKNDNGSDPTTPLVGTTFPALLVRGAGFVRATQARSYDGPTHAVRKVPMRLYSFTLSARGSGREPYRTPLSGELLRNDRKNRRGIIK
ncbi:hypothetical protein PoB_005228800 [Plakobranchus ocellatus]|uniref:Uncharacterized protein n=1 Tax=Plakobranchus ocellatus TaxID=259542 RepID=A0AAV4C473_9GAST|nr:hypothetical protein PoB_005228800 [Plakobranchus ocellatus]